MRKLLLGLILVLGLVATPTAQLAPGAPVASWQTPTFVAGDFTGNGAMTITVEAGDVTTDQYVVIGNRTVIYNIVLETVTIGGTPNNLLIRALPSWMVITESSSGSCDINDNTLRTSGIIYAIATESRIQMGHEAGATMTAATNTATFNCSITFEIN
jgi:hypothetical protein